MLIAALIVSFIPLAATLVISIIVMFAGFPFFTGSAYGPTAFADVWVVALYGFWYIYIASAVISIICAVLLKSMKREEAENENRKPKTYENRN